MIAKKRAHRNPRQFLLSVISRSVIILEITPISKFFMLPGWGIKVVEIVLYPLYHVSYIQTVFIHQKVEDIYDDDFVIFLLLIRSQVTDNNNLLELSFIRSSDFSYYKIHSDFMHIYFP